MSVPFEVEQKLRHWLRAHHGVISRAEALRLGALPKDIATKLRRGEWVPMCKGVYRSATNPQNPYQPLRAAFLALGGRGVASHTSAAWLWGLQKDPPERPELSVLAPDAGGRSIASVTIHRSRDLDLSRAVERRTILVTNPLRTLVDLAATAAPAALTEAVDVAVATRLVTVDGLAAEIDRLSRRGRPGVAALRRHLIGRGFLGAPAPSVLEARARRLILATGLPLPGIEVAVDEEGHYRIDIAWPGLRLAVEVDGFAWHFSPEHKHRDDTRRNQLLAAGWSVLVYNWRDVADEPGRLAADITAAYTRLSRPAGTTASG